MNGPPRSPRRFVRPIRLVLMAVIAVTAWWSLRPFTFVKLPDGGSPLFDVPPGARIVVRDAASDRGPRRGDAVLYATNEGTVALGRVVAVAGEIVEVEGTVREGWVRVRVGGDAGWLPALERVRGELPVREGEVLVLGEDVVGVGEAGGAGGAGGVIGVERLVGRVVVVLPF